jgi:uncharacterized protein YkwD
MRYSLLLLIIACGSHDEAPPVQQPDNVVTSASSSTTSSTTAPIASTPPTPTTSSSATDRLAPEARAILDAHNRLRAQHCAAPLVWSDTIATAAKTWVDRLAARGCALQHSQTNYGENISGGSASTQSPDQVVSLWYREHDHYDFARGGFSMRSGHFTQVVWRGSRSLGCASASCGDIRLWVCNYDPPGNMQGDFQRNVLPTTCVSH